MGASYPLHPLSSMEIAPSAGNRLAAAEAGMGQSLLSIAIYDTGLASEIQWQRTTSTKLSAVRDSNLWLILEIEVWRKGGDQWD